MQDKMFYDPRGELIRDMDKEMKRLKNKIEKYEEAFNWITSYVEDINDYFIDIKNEDNIDETIIEIVESDIGIKLETIIDEIKIAKKES